MDQADNRRASFRIEDRVLLEWQELRGNAVTPETLIEIFHKGPYSELQNRLMELKRGYQECHTRLAMQDPLTAEALSWVDERVDVLSELIFSLIRHTEQNSKLRETVVSLSNEGMGFVTTEPLQRDILLALHVVLLPEQVSLFMKVNVTRCDERPSNSGDPSYLVGFRFLDPEPHYEKLLARHLLNHQIKDSSRSAH